MQIWKPTTHPLAELGRLPMPDQPPPSAPQPDDPDSEPAPPYEWFEERFRILQTDRDAAQAAQRQAEAERDEAKAELRVKGGMFEVTAEALRERASAALAQLAVVAKERDEARAQLAEAERRAAALTALLRRYARLWHYRRVDVLEEHWGVRDGDFVDCNQAICAEARALLAAAWED